MFALQQIDHVALTVADPKKSAAWYQEVLGLRRRFEEAWGDRPVMLCAGPTCVALFPGSSSEAPAMPVARQRRPIHHVAFRAAHADFIAAGEALTQRQIPFEFQDHGIAHSIYFADPDGHCLEITTYDLPQTEKPTLV